MNKRLFTKTHNDIYTEKHQTMPCHPPLVLLGLRLAVGSLCRLEVLCTLAIFIVQSLCPREAASPLLFPCPSVECVCSCVPALSHVGSAWMACWTRPLMACTSTSVPAEVLLDWSRLSYLRHTYTYTQRERVKGHAHHTQSDGAPTSSSPPSLLFCVCVGVVPEEGQSEVSCLVAELV